MISLAYKKKCTIVSPKRCIQVLTPSSCECDLNGKYGLCRCNKLRISSRNHHGFRVGSKSNDCCLSKSKERRWGHRHTERHRWTREDGGRNWSDMSISQGMLDPPEAGRGREGSSPRTFRGSDNKIFDF